MCQRRQKSWIEGRPVGRVEVLGQRDPEEEGEAQRHVGVAREVEVELEGVGQRRLPGRRDGGRGTRRDPGVDGVHVGGERVPQEGLLGEPEGEQHHAPGEALPRVRPPEGGTVELVHHLRGAHERPRQHPGEEGHVEGVAQKPNGPRPPGPQVGEVHHVLEREERDPDGEREVEARRGPARRQHRGEAGEEVEVLEHPEKEQVHGQGRRDQARARRPGEGRAHEPVRCHRRREQGREAGIPPAVEQERQGHEVEQAQARREALDHGEADERGGQEGQQEEQRAEQHGAWDPRRPELSARARW
jgi:hypothetical protein